MRHCQVFFGMASSPLIEFRPSGLYCPVADVSIDPWQPVDKAIITHAHADHARPGHKHYLSTHTSREVLKLRLGEHIQLETKSYGEVFNIHGVRFSFHPAGHIIGSAQIRMEYKGEVWVVSGDFKTEHDYISEPFELVPCNTLITESTFGLPIFRWKPQSEIFEDINQWWLHNQKLGLTSLLGGYSLGKAQRILKNLDHSIGKVYVHGAVYNVCQALEANGVQLPPYIRVTPDQNKTDYKGHMVLAPPAALSSTWARKFRPFSSGIASGWMNLRGAKRRKAVDRGFVVSDHADWNGLNQVVKESGADQVFVTHGYSAAYSRWLNENGIESREVKTQFEGEIDEPTDVMDEKTPPTSTNNIAKF